MGNASQSVSRGVSTESALNPTFVNVCLVLSELIVAWPASVTDTVNVLVLIQQMSAWNA